MAVTLIHGPIRVESYRESLLHVKRATSHSRIGREHVDVFLAFDIPHSVRKFVTRDALCHIFKTDVCTLLLSRSRKRLDEGDSWSISPGPVRRVKGRR